jgi:CBS domain-containing membrane protein
MLVFAIAQFLGELGSIDEWLMASLGASALLVFALPQSPLAHYWALSQEIRFLHWLVLQ